MLSIENAWIKAAVEHRIMFIRYNSEETKQGLTNRDVQPDFVGQSLDGKYSGLWCAYCRLREEAPRVFQQDSIISFFVTEQAFEPDPQGRWEELIPLYKERGLANREF